MSEAALPLHRARRRRPRRPVPERLWWIIVDLLADGVWCFGAGVRLGKHEYLVAGVMLAVTIPLLGLGLLYLGLLLRAYRQGDEDLIDPVRSRDWVMTGAWFVVGLLL